MRGWIILLETAFSVLLLLIFYFSSLTYLESYKKVNINYREYIKSCDKDKSFKIIFRNGTVVECNAKGEPVASYVISGFNQYSPGIVIIYR